MTTNYLGGSVALAINESLIPAELLGEVSLDYSEGTRDVNTLAGKFTQPNGMVDTAELKFTVMLPSINYLKVLFPDLYTAGSNERAGAGRIDLTFGGCMEISSTPINIHYVCDGQDDTNDVRIANARLQVSLPLTWNDSDPLSVEVMAYIQPTDNNTPAISLGIGNLTQDSYYDYVTMTTVVS